MNALEQRLGVLIERLSADLHEALPPDLPAKLVLYIAAGELLVEEEQPRDRGALRIAMTHLALQALGVTDTDIERAKLSIMTGRAPESLNRRQ